MNNNEWSKQKLAIKLIGKSYNPVGDFDVLGFALEASRRGYWLNLQSPKFHADSLHPKQWCAIVGHADNDSVGSVTHSNDPLVAVAAALYQIISEREAEEK